MVLREIHSSDQEAILTLNQANTPHLGDLDSNGLDILLDLCHYKKVFIGEDNQIKAFLIGFLPGSTYASVNYQWFEKNYKNHCYIDRVAVVESARGKKLGQQLYEDFKIFGQQHHANYLTCEVNIRPYNEGSLLFHKKMGFEQVATQETEEGKKEVALLVKHCD